jgi:uncharacterized membrane protein (UPF0127 family)
LRHDECPPRAGIFPGLPECPPSAGIFMSRRRRQPSHNSPMKRLFVTLIALVATAAAVAQEPQMNLQRVRLAAGMHQIDAQVAATPDQRATGLMWRREMPQHEGMLFVFDAPAVQCFWMKNTLLPLSAAFVADDGSIVNVVEMKPQTLDSHCSTKPVRYVLEMNQGWFAKKGLKPGMKLTGQPFTPK